MRHSTILLRLIAAIFSTIAALSCSEGLLPDRGSCGIKMELVAECSPTKTLNDGLSTKWAEGDRISLVHKPSEGGEFIPETFTLESGKTFTGTVSNVQSVNDWYAFYPYNPSNGNPASFSFTVHPCQIQDGNDSRSHLAGAGFPLFGATKEVELSSSLSISMHNILSVADFCITNKHNSSITVKSIEFTSSADIAGPFIGDFTSDQPEFKATTGAGKTVTLMVENGMAIAPEAQGHFYLGILPHPVTKGSALNIRITAEVDGQDVSCLIAKTVPEDSAFKPGKIKSVKLNFSSEYEWKNATFNLENGQVKKYLDSAEENYTDGNYTTVSMVVLYSIGTSESNRLDVPDPVQLEWYQEASGVKTIQVFRDAAMTQEEMRMSSSGNSAEILNLIPGSRYWYKISGQDGALLSAGTFTTTGRRRIIKVSNVYDEYRANNFRDLGGIRTIDGKTLKYGKLYRGTNVDDATQEEKDYIKGYLNVGLDVELRTFETSSLGDDVDFIHGGYTGKMSEFKVGKEEGQFKKIFAKIVNNLEKGKAAFIHCKVGADRTGFVCILLEAALGVSPKECSIDYELTSFSISGLHPRNSIFTVMCREGLNYILDYEGDSFQEKACNILKGYGVPEEQIATFKREMLE